MTEGSSKGGLKHEERKRKGKNSVGVKKISWQKPAKGQLAAD